MQSVDIFQNTYTTTFGLWGSPKLKKNRENGMSFVVPSSVVQYKLRYKGIFFRDVKFSDINFRWSSILGKFSSFNILLC